MAVGLLVIRLVVGLTMVGHGAQKLFGWFGGGGIAGTGSGFEKMGYRPGRLFAALAGLGELGGGLLLALGLITPLAAATLFAVMLVATISVHLKNGFFVSDGGFEFPMMIAIVAIGIAATGPGTISLDAVLGIGWSGTEWALLALVLGGFGGSVPLLIRPRPTAPTPPLS